VLGALALCILPLLLQAAGNFWVRIADTRCCTCCWPWA
jgi:hypothetical protein